MKFSQVGFRQFISRLCLGTLGTGVFILIAINSAEAQVTYFTTLTGPSTGTTLSASARFTIVSPTTLQIDLTNTSAVAGQANRADVLSTVFFNFGSGVTVSTTDGPSNVTTALLSGSTVINSDGSTPAPSQLVNGSFVFGTQIDAERRYNYGVSSAGFSRASTSGNNGTPSASSNSREAYAFSGFLDPTTGQRAQGQGAGGGDDYTLVGSNTTSINGGGQAVPIIRGGVRLTVTGLSGLTNYNQLAGVGFGFASGAIVSPDTYAIGTGTTVVVPEPGAIALLATGLVGMTGIVYKRRIHH